MSLPKEEIARTLIEAARTRTAVHPLTNDYPDLDPDTAYEVQDAVVQARVDAGASSSARSSASRASRSSGR